MKLFMIQIGFRLEGMNTEGHDTVFAIASTKEEAFQDIKKARPYTSHIDSCLEVNQVEGFEVQIGNKKKEEEMKLWFINLGGYRPGEFGEVHKCLLFTGHSEEESKVKAKNDPFYHEGILKGSARPHIDDKHVLEQGIDDIFCVNEKLGEFSILLKPSKAAPENILTISYIPLK